MKHIESIQPEYAADDMTALLLTDATASAALTALLHNVTGCAIPPTADTPESEVEELVPLCLSILRRHWTTPLTALGDGTTPMSLADLMRRLILGRVDGNEALGIPPANANIPTAVAALTKRHIDDGLTLTLTDGTIMPLPDGLSLAQLLCGSDISSKVTELIDSNIGWEISKANTCNILYNAFPNASMVVLNCLHIKADPFTASNTIASGELHFSKAESIVEHSNTYCDTPNLDVYMDALKTTNITNNGQGIFRSRKIFLPVYEKGAWRVAGSASWGNTTTQYMYIGCKGKKEDTIRCWAYDGGQDQAQKLLDVEIREGACQNLTLAGLKHLTAENMYNHILCRLKQDEPICGEGVTITLGTTNLDKLEAVEEYNLKLTELTDTYGYTFA